MITPMIILALLVTPWVVVRVLAWHRGDPFQGGDAAAIGLGLVFILAGMGHFVQTESMALMLPPWVPGRIGLVYATGALEFCVAAGLFMRRTRRLAGWAAAAVLILFFPANVYAALTHAPMGGHAWGPVYLLVRAPLQLLLLGWTLCLVIPGANHRVPSGRSADPSR